MTKIKINVLTRNIEVDPVPHMHDWGKGPYCKFTYEDMPILKSSGRYEIYANDKMIHPTTTTSEAKTSNGYEVMLKKYCKVPTASQRKGKSADNPQGMVTVCRVNQQINESTDAYIIVYT